MSDSLLFECIYQASPKSIDIIFVHGLTGDPKKTWSSSADEFWPEWLKTDLPYASIYTLGYPASLFEKWAKKEMDLFERSTHVLEMFAANGIGKKPIAFIAHSLGGILVKMILRKACDAEDEDWKSVGDKTQLVHFMSTPHCGASLARCLDVLPLTSKNIKLLANDTGFLEDLNSHYRTYANNKGDLKTVIYYEKYKTKKTVVVVDRGSADAGVAGCEPVAMDKDHIDICKPIDQSDLVYLGTSRHLKKLDQSVRIDFGVTGEGYSEKAIDDRRDLLQKLIDAGREHEYPKANNAQSKFARQYRRTGLFTKAREDHDLFLAEIESRFLMHIYHPLICADASDADIRGGLQTYIFEPLNGKRFGETKFDAMAVLNGLYYLTEQCNLRWDPEVKAM